MPTQRLFAAIWLPPPVVTHLRAALAPVTEKLASDPTRALRLTRPETWHITLAFLGDTDAEKARARFDRLTPVAAVPLAVVGAGHFGLTVWAGVRHGPWLPELALAAQAGLHCPDRRFRAHVTVARQRSRRTDVEPVIAALADYAGPAWLPDELLLVRSHLGPQSYYEPVARLALPSRG